MPELSGLEAAPLHPRAASRAEDPALQRVVDNDVCDRAERAGIAACLSKDDLEAVPRVAFELAFAWTSDCELGREAAEPAAALDFSDSTRFSAKRPG